MECPKCGGIGAKQEVTPSGIPLDAEKCFMCDGSGYVDMETIRFFYNLFAFKFEICRIESYDE